jgi:polyphosphate kinase
MDSDKVFPYIERDVSWLGFNYRVLQEAKDSSVPLMERIKFLAIYSNNLDEFFRVRVAQLRNLERVGKKTRKQLDFDPHSILVEVLSIVNQQQEEFSEIFQEQIIPELENYNIHLRQGNDLTKAQIDFIESYFRDNMLPFVQPVLLVEDRIKPFLSNASLYLAMELKIRGKETQKLEYAIVKIPSDHLPRFIELPPSRHGHKEVIILDDIVRQSLQWIFPGYEVVNSFSIKLTRDAELYIDDEYSGDLISKIKKSLNKRNVGPAARLVYDREMPKKLLDYLQHVFELDEFDLLPEGRYHNNFDFFSFPDFGMKHLKDLPLPPLPYPELEGSESIFEAMKRRDHLINVPYHSYESVVRLFEESAEDPWVTHIKIVQYRVAQDSRIMKALIRAVQKGKKVNVFIEVKARFDEEANLKWGELLESSGVQVHYSLPGLKVHSKMALIIRRERNQRQLYAYLSTGNFHEVTAKIYSDYGFFTTEQRIAREIARLFSFLETVKVPSDPFEHLLVGQFNLRFHLEELIDQEISEAKKGRPTEILLKLNSLQDPEVIQHLYRASQAGVRVRLIIRGICSLVPGEEGLSENIEAISIVDRYLEHARVYVFHDQGRNTVYLSSADWMVRNLSHRIETAFPVFDDRIKKMILDNLELQWSDNVKSRWLHEDKLNEYRRGHSELAIRSQTETYYYYKRLLETKLKSLELVQEN